jgi:protein gp37
MGAQTNIGWTDATVNFWHGCTKVGPGCDFCYAEQWSKRTGHNIWGVGVPRRKIKSAVPLIEKLARKQPGARVFIQSMSDLFDNEVPIEWFDDAWDWICICDTLRIQIVTKRVSIIEKRLAEIDAPGWPKHAGLIVTVVDQEEADRDVPRARALKAKLGIPWLGLSIEPQIGPIIIPISPTTGFSSPLGIDWAIGGGESKQGRDHQPRPYDLAWARSLRDQCAAAGVAYFQKQLGARPRGRFFNDDLDAGLMPYDHIPLKDRQAGADPSEWPVDLRVQNFPEALR